MAARAAGGARRKEVEDPNNTWNMQLMAALLRGDITEATALVAKGANVNHTVVEPTMKGARITPFLAVSLKGAGVLCGMQGNPNPVNAGVMPATELVGVLQWLCQNGADPNAQFDGNKGTIIHYGVRNDLIDLLEKLMANRLVMSEPAPPPPPQAEAPVTEVAKASKASPSKKTGDAAALQPIALAQLAIKDPPVAAVAAAQSPEKAADRAPAQDPHAPPRDLFDLDAVDDNGCTAMQLAINSAKIDAGRTLLRNGCRHAFSALVDGCRNQTSRACLLGDTQLLEVLLNLGDDPWQIDAAGQTLLHTATHPAIIDMLLDRGLSPNVLNSAGQTPLSYVVSHRPTAAECIDVLLSRGADANIGDAGTGLTPLMHAVIGFCPDVCKKLLNEGKADINARDAMGCTAVHWAATARGKGILEQLIPMEGIELNAQDRLGQTALHRSCNTLGHADFAACLLSKDVVDVNIADHNGNTPLHVCVLRNNEAAMKALMVRVDHAALAGPAAAVAAAAPAANAKAADAKKPPPKKGAPIVEVATASKLAVDAENKGTKTALQIASSLNHVALVKALVAVGANVNRSSSNGNLVHDAVAHRNAELITLYAKKLAGLNDRNADDKTPLHLAVELADESCVAALIECGASVNEQESHHLTAPIHVACKHGRHALRDRLIEAGAVVSVTDDCVRTPLHHAAANADADTVKVLMTHGADTGAVDATGATPLHAACAVDAVECLDALLVDANTDLWARDDRQRTPLHVAVACGALRCTERICNLVIDFHATGVIPRRGAMPATRSPVDFADGRPSSRMGQQRRPPTPAELEPSGTIEHEGVIMAVDGAAARAKYLRATAKRVALEASWRDALKLQDADGRYPLALASLCGATDIAKLLLKTNTIITAKSREAAGLPPRPPSVPIRSAPMDL